MSEHLPDMTFPAFMKKFHPSILEEYDRFTRRKILPEPGDRLVSLRPGFSGGAGEYLIVERVYFNDTYGHTCIEVRNTRNGSICISTAREWWKDLRPATEEDKGWPE